MPPPSPFLYTWQVAMVVGREWQGCISLQSRYPDIILHEKLRQFYAYKVETFRYQKTAQVAIVSSQFECCLFLSVVLAGKLFKGVFCKSNQPYEWASESLYASLVGPTLSKFQSRQCTTGISSTAQVIYSVLFLWYGSSSPNS